MAKVTFASLKLKTNEDIKTFIFNDKEIEVKQYLPAADKNSILELAMQKADETTVINTFALDALFHLFIVMKYTNITFTDTQKEDLLKLYDICESNGLIQKVIEVIPEEEYNTLRDNLIDMLDNYNKYRNSARALVEQFSMFAPQQAENIAEKLKDLDVEKVKELFDVTKETGGFQVV